MAGVVCPKCDALTSTWSGYCDVCRQPLAVAPIAAAPQPAVAAQPPYATAAAYAPPPTVYAYPAPAPFYPAPLMPGYPPAPYGYAQGYVYPVFAAFPQDPIAEKLAKDAIGSRLAAAVVDLLLLGSLWAFLFFGAYPLLLPGSLWLIRPVCTFLIFYLYYTAFDGIYGQTPGKRTAGVKVVTENLGKISQGQAAVRSLEILFWIFLVLGLIVQLVLLFDGGQSVGDRIAKTYVIRAR